MISFVPGDPAARRCHTVIDSPLGGLLLVGDGHALSYVDLLGKTPIDPGWCADAAPFADAIDQLRAYFAGDLTAFELVLAPEGTAFQLEVWQRLAEIPYGETTTYGKIAADLGRSSAARAVGAANGRNPIPVILPCHRVVAASGDLIRYGLGGLGNKRFLLDLESGRRPVI